MYRLSLSEKLVSMVVIKGWPATAESVVLSFLMCSTCFKRMTVEHALAVLLLERTRYRALTVDFTKDLQREDFLRVPLPWSAF